MSLLIVPYELLSLIINLLNIGSKFSLSRVCNFFVNFLQSCDELSYQDVLIDMVCNDNINLFRWLKPDINTISSRLAQKYCDKAAETGSLQILKYIHNAESLKNCRSIIAYAVLGIAVYKDHLEIVKYLHKDGCHWNKTIFGCAAYGGHLEIVKYLHENGCPWDKEVFVHAAYGGHLEILKYLYKNGCPWVSGACTIAAIDGRLDILKYLHENGYPWKGDECTEAALYNHLEILKYLHENGCHWTINTCTCAAINGHMEILNIYMRTNVLGMKV